MKGEKYGNLWTIIPGIILCIFMTGMVLLIGVGTDMLLPQDQREKIEQSLHLNEIIGIFVENPNAETTD